MTSEILFSRRMFAGARFDERSTGVALKCFHYNMSHQRGLSAGKMTKITRQHNILYKTSVVDTKHFTIAEYLPSPLSRDPLMSYQAL